MRRPHPWSRRRLLAAGVTVVAMGAVAGLVAVRGDGGSAPAAAPGGPSSGGSGPTPQTASTTQTPQTASALPASTAAPATTPAATQHAARAPSAAAREVQRLRTLVASSGTGSTSVAATDLTTGRSARAGSASGMTTASVAKLQLLETLLLQHERAGTALTDDETDTVTAMIENSSNEAADDTYYDIGGRATVVSYEARLGLSTRTTVPGDGVYWGLTTTSADQQLVLLRNLVAADSPLTASDRAFALSLMRHVESDQRWGVPVAADGDGTGAGPAVKNGWLAVTADDDRWAVNSVGVITVDGDTVLVAVMTQHGASFAGGIDRVEALARAAVTAVTP